MTTYNQISEELINNEAKEFYRFQGHNSFECYDIRNNRFNNDSHYVYVSNSKDHHYYFTVKRIKQLINTIVLNGTDYQITKKQITNNENYKNIKKIIFNSDKVRNLNSISLVCDQVYYALLKENCINSYQKTKDSGIERVDRKVFGGGYGVTDAWLDLFNDLTYFSSHLKISTIDVLNLLKKMKNKGIQTSPQLIQDILETKQRNYIISPNLYDDFHKYTIMNDLERICQNGLYLEGSSFYTHPSKTIKEVLNSYKRKREKILTKIDRQYYHLSR